MIVLGIETSCDETAAAVVSSDRTILSDEIFSQLDDHRPYGGVVPEVAARAHLQHLDGLIARAMETAKVDFGDLDMPKQVNPYHVGTLFEDHQVRFLEAVIKVIKFGTERQWYDRSDAMTDYFDTAFYLDVEMGRWGKPYVKTDPRKLKGSTNYDQDADDAIAWNRIGAVA